MAAARAVGTADTPMRADGADDAGLQRMVGPGGAERTLAAGAVEAICAEAHAVLAHAAAVAAIRARAFGASEPLPSGHACTGTVLEACAVSRAERERPLPEAGALAHAASLATPPWVALARAQRQTLAAGNALAMVRAVGLARRVLASGTLEARGAATVTGDTEADSAADLAAMGRADLALAPGPAVSGVAHAHLHAGARIDDAIAVAAARAVSLSARRTRPARVAGACLLGERIGPVV